MTVGDFRKRDVRRLLPMCRPTVLVGVPRVFESLLSSIESAAARGNKARAFRRAKALSAGTKKWTGLNVGKALFRRIHRELFGGTQLRFCCA